MASKPPTGSGAKRPARPAQRAAPEPEPRKLIAFHPETLQALQLLGRDSMKDLQDLADEAFRDLLRKHGRPASLKEALRQSTRTLPANDQPDVRAKKRRS